jgi:hypothetical protein
MNMEQLVEWEFVGETELLLVNPVQCDFVHQKFYVAWHGN